MIRWALTGLLTLVLALPVMATDPWLTVDTPNKNSATAETELNRTFTVKGTASRHTTSTDPAQNWTAGKIKVHVYDTANATNWTADLAVDSATLVYDSTADWFTWTATVTLPDGFFINRQSDNGSIKAIGWDAWTAPYPGIWSALRDDLWFHNCDAYGAPLPPVGPDY